MPCPADHEIYCTQAEADADLRRLIANAKKSGKGGKSWKRLNVFPCGNHFHVGRANALPQRRPTSTPVKPPSPGSLRRQAKRDAKAAKRQIRFIQITYGICGTADELEENARIAQRMVEKLFSAQ